MSDSDTRPYIHFHATSEKLSEIEIGDFLDIEENPNNIRLVLNLMAQFLVDEEGHSLPEKEARERMRRVTLTQLQEAYRTLFADVRETAVPNG